MGIESTAHTFGVGIVDENSSILSDARDMYTPPRGWGIEPFKAAAHHRRVAGGILQSALAEAHADLKDIDLIAVSQGAGLPPCLRVGLDVAGELAGKTGKPLVPVCHQVAHLEIARLLTHLTEPVFCYASGGNTQILVLSAGRYRVFGETQDIGLGNALDKFARAAGLQFPGGPKIEQLARKGRYCELPYVVKGMDLSFSGILTAALTLRKKGKCLEDVCFSLQETLFSMLTEVAERAMAHTGRQELTLTGGVAANVRLVQMLTIMASERGADFRACPLKYCGDCGPNIAWTGLLAYKSGEKFPASTNLDSKPRWRTDDVDIRWS